MPLLWPASGMYVNPPLFVSAGSYGGAFTGTSISLGTPAGIASGDMLLTFLFTNNDSNTWTAPSGWSLLTSETSGSKLWCYQKVAGASEPASYTWTASFADFIYGDTVAYSAALIGDYAGASSVTAPSVNAAIAAETVVCAYYATSSGATITLPGSLSSRFNSGSTAGGELAIGDFEQSTPGATPTRTATISSGAGMSLTVSIRA